jgi:hypothetical protein
MKKTTNWILFASFVLALTSHECRFCSKQGAVESANEGAARGRSETGGADRLEFCNERTVDDDPGYRRRL